MKVVPLDTDEHHAVQALLPWAASGRLDRDDAQRVEQHLATCASCRDELARERELQAIEPWPEAAPDVEHDLARMHALIAAGPQRARLRAPTWLRWALGAQAVMIVLLATALWLPRPDTDVFRTLGAPDHAAAANALVMFKSSATEEEIRAALRSVGARLVDGPTASNAYLLRVPSDGHSAAITRLRAQPAVSLAQSLDARATP
jgi:predicted anti-sigma-YlaC factor YlaD